MFLKVLLATRIMVVKLWKGIWPTLTYGLMTILSPAGQFSSMDNPLPSIFIHDQQQVSFLVHGSKIVNYHNAVAEDIW